MALGSVCGWCLCAPLMLVSASPAGAADPAVATLPSEASLLRVYIGTYTGAKSKGIYLYHFDPRTGGLRPVGLAAEVQNPSFLAPSPSGKYLYSVGEVSKFRDQAGGAVSAFSVAPESGRLALINQQPSGGVGPCYVSLDPQGRYALVANYGSGSVAVLPIQPDGRLGEPSAIDAHKGSGPNSKRQEGAHAHSISLDPTARFALSADLGTDRLYVYRFDADKGSLTAHDPPAAQLPPGAGPRHFAIHPTGRFVYVANELNSTVTAFVSDFARGALREVQTLSTLPDEFGQTNHPADVHTGPSGKFLYCSNRGHDSIAVFSIDARTGRLAPVGHESTRGKWPRNFAIDPTGQWLIAANQNTDSLAVFRLDRQTGRLTPAGELVEAPSPACVLFAAQVK